MDDSGDLVAFLIARLDGLEREAQAGTVHARNCATWKRLYENGPSATRYGCDCLVVNWLLLDIEAKRRLIEEYRKVDELLDDHRDAASNFERGVWAGLNVAVRLTTLPFDWHPDYRGEWKP